MKIAKCWRCQSRGLWYIAGGSVDWHSHIGKQTFSPVTEYSLLGMYQQKMCTSMFIGAAHNSENLETILVPISRID